MKTYRIIYPTLGGASVKKEEIDNKDLKVEKELIDNEDFKAAIKLWFDNKNEAIKKYGHISDWILIAVKDMSYAFENKEKFNEDISKWDTSNVINMEGMFKGAKEFNQPIGEWETSNVLNMESMFEGAEAFNQPIQSKPKEYLNPKQIYWNRSWNVQNVTNMKNMFKGAKKFDQLINNWDTSKVENMEGMFEEAEDFNQPVDYWNVSNVTNMENMFKGAKKFNQDIDSKLIIKFIELTDKFQTFFYLGNGKTEKEDKHLYIIYGLYISWNPSNVLNFKNMFEKDFKKIPEKWYINKDAKLSENLEHLKSDILKKYLKNLSPLTNIASKIRGKKKGIKKSNPINDAIMDETEDVVGGSSNIKYIYKYDKNNGKEILVKNKKTLDEILNMGKDNKENIIFLKEDEIYKKSSFPTFEIKIPQLIKL